MHYYTVIRFIYIVFLENNEFRIVCFIFLLPINLHSILIYIYIYIFVSSNYRNVIKLYDTYVSSTI